LERTSKGKNTFPTPHLGGNPRPYRFWDAHVGWGEAPDGKGKEQKKGLFLLLKGGGRKKQGGKGKEATPREGGVEENFLSIK